MAMGFLSKVGVCQNIDSKKRLLHTLANDIGQLIFKSVIYRGIGLVKARL